MISIRRISLGGGYRYLMESVAVGDGDAGRSNDLSRYYAASGTPPGVFLGAGLADLDVGRGVETGSEVAEKHLEAMLAGCADPITGEAVGGTPKAPRGGLPVAGFDLTFSPPKSVSVASALADEGTNAVIYECHRRAVSFVIGYAEAHVFRSRSETNGIVEEDISGVVHRSGTTLFAYYYLAGQPGPVVHQRPRSLGLTVQPPWRSFSRLAGSDRPAASGAEGLAQCSLARVTAGRRAGRGACVAVGVARVGRIPESMSLTSGCLPKRCGRCAREPTKSPTPSAPWWQRSTASGSAGSCRAPTLRGVGKVGPDGLGLTPAGSEASEPRTSARNGPRSFSRPAPCCRTSPSGRERQPARGGRQAARSALPGRGGLRAELQTRERLKVRSERADRTVAEKRRLTS